MLKIDDSLTVKDLVPALRRLFELSGKKIEKLEKRWNPAHGTPVFTVAGKYATRGWTEWTQGFQFGGAVLQFRLIALYVKRKIIQHTELRVLLQSTGDTPPHGPPFRTDLAVLAVVHPRLEDRP